jgi:S1-C subfamily serine protease
LHSGDVIVALDGAPVADVDDLQRVLAGDKIGTSIPIHVVRRDRTLTLALVPAEVPQRTR